MVSESNRYSPLQWRCTHEPKQYCTLSSPDCVLRRPRLLPGFSMKRYTRQVLRRESFGGLFYDTEHRSLRLLTSQEFEAMQGQYGLGLTLTGSLPPGHFCRRFS